MIGIDLLGIGDEDLVEQRIVDRAAHGGTRGSFESRIYGDAEINGGGECRAEDILNMVKKSVVGADEAAIAGIVNIEVGMAVRGGKCGTASGIRRGGVVDGAVAGRGGGNTGPI